MKDLRFSVFDDEFKLIKKRRNNIIVTEKKSICFFKGFLLQNKKTFVHKREK